MALGILTKVESFCDYFSLRGLPTIGSPDWCYHDLWDLNERALLEQRHELGMEGRALVERYHETADDEARSALVPRLSALYRRRQAIIQELGTRDLVVVTRALVEHTFDQRRREREEREREEEEREREEEIQRQRSLEQWNAREEATRQTFARMDKLLEEFHAAPIVLRHSAHRNHRNDAVATQSRAVDGAPIPANQVNLIFQAN